MSKMEGYFLGSGDDSVCARMKTSVSTSVHNLENKNQRPVNVFLYPQNWGGRNRGIPGGGLWPAGLAKLANAKAMRNLVSEGKGGKRQLRLSSGLSETCTCTCNSIHTQVSTHTCTQRRKEKLTAYKYELEVSKDSLQRAGACQPCYYCGTFMRSSSHRQSVNVWDQAVFH